MAIRMILTTTTNASQAIEYNKIYFEIVYIVLINLSLYYTFLLLSPSWLSTVYLVALLAM